MISPLITKNNLPQENIHSIFVSLNHSIITKLHKKYPLRIIQFLKLLKITLENYINQKTHQIIYNIPPT